MEASLLYACFQVRTLHYSELWFREFNNDFIYVHCV